MPLTAVVASDGSAPAVEGLSELEGKVVLEGITVELWDGIAWLPVVQDLDATRLKVGEILTPTALLKGRDIPAGSFSRFRLSVRRARAELALELHDRWFGGEVVLGEDVVVEDDLNVFDVHGAQLFWIVLETVANVTEQAATDGSAAALVEGDLGTAILRLRSHTEPTKTAIVASDGSAPDVEGLEELEGKVLLEGVTVELWNGTAWRTVVAGLEAARLVAGEIEAATLLATLDGLPEDDYSRARLSVRRASARLAVALGDLRFGGEVLLGEDVVVEKELELLEEHGDHAANVLWIVLHTIADVTRQTADDGSVSLHIEGDLGSAVLPPLAPPAPKRTALVVSDASDPEVDALEELKGKLLLEGVAVELWNGTEWRSVVDHLEAVRLEVGEPREPALLLLTDEIPGEYSRARISARRATARLALELGDRWFGGEALLGEEIVVEAELEVIDKDDHDARVFWIVVEAVTEVTRQVADDGTVSLLVAGDFGAATLPELQHHQGIRFEVIERVHTAGPSSIRERVRAVIRSADEWERFWNALNEGIDPRPELPRIDFEEHMVVVAAMGERSTGGYAIEIAHAYETDDGIAIKVVEVSPGLNCAVPEVITAPVTAVIMKSSDREVEFVEVAVRREC